MKALIAAAATGWLALAASLALAQSVQDVVPEAERQAALDQLADGAPVESSGIESVRILGAVSLDGEFDDPSGRVLRTREIVLGPGAKVALHRHEGRPGVAYIIEGELTEYRVGADGRAVTTVKKAGDAALERTGVVHWWRNESSGTVRALVVGIVPADPQ